MITRMTVAGLAAALLVPTLASTGTAAPATAGHELRIDAVDRDGRVPGADNLTVTVLDLEHGDEFPIDPGIGRIRLPAGRYAVDSQIRTPRAGLWPSVSYIVHPELRITGDTSVRLDARTGQPASMVPEDRAARGGAHTMFRLYRISACGCLSTRFQVLNPLFDEAYVATVPGTSSPGFAFAQRRLATQPVLELATLGARPVQVTVTWWRLSPQPAERAVLPAVHGGQGTPADLAKIDARNRAVVVELPADSTYQDAYERTVTIAKAGARLAVITIAGDTGARNEAMADEPELVPPLPTVWAFGPPAGRFLEQIRTGSRLVRYASRPTPEPRYELAAGVLGKVDTAQAYRPRTRDLAAVPVTYHDNAPGTQRHLSAGFEFFGSTMGVPLEVPPTAAPQSRTEYFTPGRWMLSVQSPGAGPLREARQLRAGANPPLAWDKAVVGPGFHGTTADPGKGGAARPWAWRKDGAIDVILPMYSDSAGRPRTSLPRSGLGTDTGMISLYRNGTPVGTEPDPELARFAVPAEPATYRLDAQARRTAGWWPLSTLVSARWTFRSSAADEGKALPLLTVRFDPELDSGNRAPGGRVFSFPSIVERQGGGPVDLAAYRVEVSYDDGRSWRTAGVSRTGTGWTVTVRHVPSGYVSLRATATDRAWNAVTQTVIRAYQVGR